MPAAPRVRFPMKPPRRSRYRKAQTRHSASASRIWTGGLVKNFFLAVVFVTGTLAAQTSPYAQWSNGPSTDPNYFPIGVYLQSPSNVPEFKNIGINTYVGFYGDLDQTSLSQLATAQMPLLPTQNSVGLTSAQRTDIIGWTQVDEPDNAQPDGTGGYTDCIMPSVLVSRYNAIRANDTSRPVYLNFSQGVSNIGYIGRGSTCNNYQPTYA